MGDERLIAVLEDIGRRVFSHELRIRNRLGLSRAEYKGILCIGEEERINCQELSKRMDLSVSRGSRVVDRLFAGEYIRREGCDSDRRCKNIWLTQKGIDTRRTIEGEIQMVENSLTSGYPEAKITLLKSDLKRLSQKL